jgi:hypothetical protein
MSGLREFTVEEFLAYETRGRGAFLGADWKKQGWIQVWLHRRRPFAAGWQHQIPRIDVRDDPTGTPKRQIFSGNYRCIESEETLKNQYRRDRDTGERTHPPEVCPICKIVEYARREVDAGRMHWLEPVFDFDVGNRDSRVLIRAAGMWNGYKPDKMSDRQKEELSEAGISLKHGWKESMTAGLKYVFCLVDAAAPAKGVQIMKEGQALGDKVKIAIAKEMKRNPRNPKLGDPVQNPYAFCFEYREQESPDKKYEAFRVELDLDPQIQELINSPAPDIGMLSGDYVPETLRSQLEKAACIELPWDEFFTAEAAELLKKEDGPEEPKPERAPAPQAPSGRPAPAPRGRAPQAPPSRAAAPAQAPQRAPSPPPSPKVDMVACDRCNKAMPMSDSVCPHCGMRYEVEAAEPEPAPPLRKRSEAKRSVPAPPAPRGAASVIDAPRASRPQAREARPVDDANHGERPAAAGDDTSWGDFGNDEIPF